MCELYLTKYHDLVGMGEVSGKVVDHSSDQEIPGVEVTLRLLNNVAIASSCTDTRDDMMMSVQDTKLRVPAGKYSLKFEHDSYESAYLGAN